MVISYFLNINCGVRNFGFCFSYEVIMMFNDVVRELEWWCGCSNLDGIMRVFLVGVRWVDCVGIC